MNREKAREHTKRIENLIGCKAKQELIRSIQEKKGDPPCYQTGQAFCDQYACTWRSTCKPGEV